MRLKPFAAAALAAALALPASAPAQNFSEGLGLSEGLGGVFGMLAAGGPFALNPRIAGEATPIQIWIAPGPASEGALQVEGRARVERAKAHAERILAAALRQQARGTLHIEGVALSALSADARAFALEGVALHAPRPGAPLARAAFQARIPYVVAPEGLKLRPEGRIAEAPPALRAAFGALLQPVDLAPQAQMEGARLLSFTPALSAGGALEARAAFLATPQALANFWALAASGGL